MPIDMGSIMSVGGSLKSAADMARGMLEVRDESLIRERTMELLGKVLEAQSKAIEAQGEYDALLREKRLVEDKLAQSESWSSEASRYELKQYGLGVYVYAQKEGAEEGEPIHFLCANCYMKRQKSILQCITTDGFFQCHACDQGFQLGERERLRVQRSGGGTGGWMGA